MGKSGDQSLEYKQNKTLYESNNNDIRVFLFESYVDGEYIFSGEVRLSKEPFFVEPQVSTVESSNDSFEITSAVKIIIILPIQDSLPL